MGPSLVWVRGGRPEDGQGLTAMSLYVPILVLAGLGAFFAVFSVTMGVLAGPKRWNRAKLSAYESGIEPTPQPLGGGKFPVKYYLTAMLFIVFDIEIIFLYPWAVAFDKLGVRSEEHTSELQSHLNLVCRLLLEKKKKNRIQ